MSESTEGYDPSTDPDADPESLNPRDAADESDETYADADADPDMMNPRADPGA